MTQFRTLINDGVLIAAEFNSEQVKNAFSEVVSLLEDHQNRIKKLESTTPTLFSKKGAKKLSDRLTNLENSHETFQNYITKNTQNDKDELLKQITSLKEWVEDQNSVVLVDVRRFINSELESYVLKSDLNDMNFNNQQPIIQRDFSDPQISSRLASSITELQKRIEQLESNQNLYATKEELSKINVNVPTDVIEDNKNKIANIEEEIKKLKEMRTPEPLRRNDSMEQYMMPLREAGSSSASVTNFIRTPSMSVFSIAAAGTPQQSKLFQAPEPNATPSKPSFPLSSPVILGADTADYDRAVRKQNEVVLNIKQLVTDVNERLTALEQKYNGFVKSVSNKHLALSQNIDQLTEQFARAVQTIIKDPSMKELVAPLSRKIQVLEGRLTEVENRKYPQAQVQSGDSTPKSKPSTDVTPIPSPTPTPDDMLEKARASGQVSSFSTPLGSKQNSMADLERSYEFAPVDSAPRIKNSETKIQIIKHGDKNAEQLMEALQRANNVPTISQDEIQEKVDNAIRKTLGGFTERVKKAVKQDVDEQLKVVQKVQTLIETKIDRDFVERMFNKFRVIINELKESFDNTQLTFQDWVTRDELEEVLTRFSQSLQDIKDTAGTTSKYRCLLCGRPRTHLAGMLISSARSEEEDISEKIENSERPRTGKSRSKAPKSIRRPSSHAMPRDLVQLITGKNSKR